MIYIFEDKKSSPVSSLICKIYDNTVFTGGNRFLYDALSSNEDSLCVVDVSPDNTDTVNLYNELRYEFGDRVYRFPCVEFSVVFMLFDLGFKFSDSDVENTIKLLHGKHVEYEAKYLERYYKGIINSYPKYCIRNHADEAKVSFYDSKCDCTQQFAINCKHNISTDEKAKILSKYLAFDFGHEELNTLYDRLSAALCN